MTPSRSTAVRRADISPLPFFGPRVGAVRIGRIDGQMSSTR